MAIKDQILSLKDELPSGVTLVAVSKTYPADAIQQAYDAGQRVFGESRPQELAAKYAVLPQDIEWHMIGHLQTNKVKYIAPFVSLIHSADSDKLLQVIDKEARKNDRVIDVLLEVRIAREETKHGWDETQLMDWIATGVHRALPCVRIRGLMGIATYTEDLEQVREEFLHLKSIFVTLQGVFGTDFDTLSIGMSGDYRLAVNCGSTMVRVGSRIFGTRNYSV